MSRCFRRVDIDLTPAEQRELLKTIVVVPKDEVLDTDRFVAEIATVPGLPGAPGMVHFELQVVQRLVPKPDSGESAAVPTPAPPQPLQKTVQPVLQPALDLTSRATKTSLKRPAGDPPAGDPPKTKRPAEKLVLDIAGWGRVEPKSTKQVLAAAFQDLRIPIEPYRQGPTGEGTLRFKYTDVKRPAIETAKQAAAEASKNYNVDVEDWISENGLNSDKAPQLAALLSELRPSKPRCGTTKAAAALATPSPSGLQVENIDSDQESVVRAWEGEQQAGDTERDGSDSDF